MNFSRRSLATWMATALLIPLGWVTIAAPAAATTVTDNLPTLNVTLPAGSAITDISHDTPMTDVTFSVENPDGSLDYPEAGDGEIKGRGNYTWYRIASNKKPYQIKLADKAPLLGMGSAKTWVLLANAADASLMRNAVAFDLARAIGMPFTNEFRWVDLRVNGEERGNYLLTEKVEVKENRVALTSPQGILAEMDNSYGRAEDFYFTTTASKTVFTLKDATSGVPDPTQGESLDDAEFQGTRAGWNDMQATLNSLDSLLAAPTPNWSAITNLIDVDSFVRYYFVNELTENPEITTSSIYFYKDGPTDKLHAGPVWDFDSSLGNYDKTESLGAFTNSSYTKNAQILRRGGNGWHYHLFRNPQFVKRANQLWAGGIAYQTSLVPSRIDGYRAQIAKSADRNFVKWPILGTPTLLIATQGKTYATTYAGEVAYLRNWVAARSAHLQKEYGHVPTARYQSHVQNLGWRPFVNAGQISGTVGQSLRMEALNLSLVNPTGGSGAVTGNAHVQNLGWSGWKDASALGTTGRGLRMEAIQLRLTGNLALKYDIQYRAHVQNIGWQAWVSNGATAGTTGKSLRVEAIQVRLMYKTPPAPVPAP